MGGQIKFIAGLVFLTIFVMAIVTYSINYGNDQDSAIKLGNDTVFNNLKTNIQREVINFSKNVNNSAVSFSKASVEAGDETTRTGGEFKQAVTAPYNALKLVIDTINLKILGGKGSEFAFITTLFGALALFITVVYTWKTWKGGNPD